MVLDNVYTCVYILKHVYIYIYTRVYICIYTYIYSYSPSPPPDDCFFLFPELCVFFRFPSVISTFCGAPQALVFRPAMILCGASAYPRAAWLDGPSNGLAPTPRIRHQISRSKMKKANGMVRMNYKKRNVDLATSIRRLICYVVESSKPI